MPRTKQLQRRDTVEVFISDERVAASKAQRVIPQGFRQATLEEVTLRYRRDAKFREELWNKGIAWTSQKGLGTSGFHEISEDGKHIGTTENRFYNELRPEQRSYHYDGGGSVAVDVYDFYLGVRRLGVDAVIGSSDVARVAYVKDGHFVATPQATPNGVVVPTEQFNAAKDAFRKTGPALPP